MRFTRPGAAQTPSDDAGGMRVTLDLDRIEGEYMSFIHRIPSSETVGLKDDYNGPICYTPDGNPLVGPAPGLRNMWLAEGFSFGITAAGGTGSVA